jgi:tRNA-2-methylthio-N6-dimethylallyladenosine synthase
MIVGFPGETPDDFQASLDLIKRVEFDGLFAFKYSDRPNAAASRFPEKIPEKEKNKRLQQVLELQHRFTTKKNQALEGSTQLILVEGLSKKQSKTGLQRTTHDVQLTGRTSTNKTVNFFRSAAADFPEEKVVGREIHVRIVKGFSHSLWGEPVNVHARPFGLRGEESYVA